MAQAKGAGGADVVLTQHLQHGGAHHARQISDPAKPHGEGRQHKVPGLIPEISRLAGADHRKQAPFHRKQQQHPDGHHKRRHGDGADRDNAGHLVQQAVAAHGGKAAKRNRQDRRPAQRGQAKDDRLRQHLADHRRHRSVGEHVAAQITLQHVADELAELHIDGLVQPHLGNVLGLDFRCRPGAQRDGYRITRNQMDQAEQQQHGGEGNNHRQTDASDGIDQHAAPWLRSLACRPLRLTTGIHSPR